MVDRPKLQRYKSQWIVWVNGVGTAAETPRAAIEEALVALSTGSWCDQCAGTGVSRQWAGDGLPASCDGCGGGGCAK